MSRNPFSKDYDPFELDWTRDDDYNPEGAEWRDATTVQQAGTYQVEIDVMAQGHFRHRSRLGNGPWKQGLPPLRSEP